MFNEEETRGVEHEVLREAGIDLTELTEKDPDNEDHDVAMGLLGKIREEFADEPFTLENVDDAFNSLTLDPGQSADDWDADPDYDDDSDTTNDEENRCFASIQVDYNEEHLDYLVSCGHLVYYSEDKTYVLSDTSGDAADVLDFSS